MENCSVLLWILSNVIDCTQLVANDILESLSHDASSLSKKHSFIDISRVFSFVEVGGRLCW